MGEIAEIASIRFHLKTTTAFRLPQDKDAIFRGGFGQFFRDLVCVTREPACAGCKHLASCAYSVVFETPVLGPPLDARETLPAGMELFPDFTLIGRSPDYLPHFIRVVDAMGQAGRYTRGLPELGKRTSSAENHACARTGHYRFLT
jgi:hypothetical protein